MTTLEERAARLLDNISVTNSELWAAETEAWPKDYYAAERAKGERADGDARTNADRAHFLAAAVRAQTLDSRGLIGEELDLAEARGATREREACVAAIKDEAQQHWDAAAASEEDDKALADESAAMALESIADAIAARAERGTGT